MNKEEIKKDLDQLERKIEMLKVEYEKFFVGILKIEPLPLKKQIELLIKKYATTQMNNVMLSFRYRNLLARFITYQEYWTRILKLIEEGKNPKDYRKLTERFQRDAEKEVVAKSEAMEKAEAAPPAAAGDDRMKQLYAEYTAILKKRNMKVPSAQAFRKSITDVENKVKSKYGPAAEAIFAFEESESGVKIKTKVKKS